jgi:hypothetical protein
MISLKAKNGLKGDISAVKAGYAALKVDKAAFKS